MGVGVSTAREVVAQAIADVYGREPSGLDQLTADAVLAALREPLVLELRALARAEFAEKGTLDPRGAAIWDCADWLDRRLTEGSK